MKHSADFFFTFQGTTVTSQLTVIQNPQSSKKEFQFAFLLLFSFILSVTAN